MKIVRIACLLLIYMLFCLQAPAQDILTISKTTARSYTGNIGQKRVRLNLNVRGNTVSGQYVYLGTSTPIELSGTIDGNNISATINPDILAGDDNTNNDGYIARGKLTASFEDNENITGSVNLDGNSTALSVKFNKIFEVSYIDTALNASFLNHNPAYNTDTVYSLTMKEVQFLDLPYRKKMKYINSWYSYPFVSVMSKNDYKDLNSVGGIKLEEMGFKDGDYLMEQKKTYKHPGFPYTYKNSYSVAYIDPHFLSVQSDIYVYDGAQHPFTLQTYKSYDLATGDSLKLDSLFLRGGKYILDSVGEICFKKQLGIPADADLYTAGYYWNDSIFHVSNNFYFTISGICFVYNRFDIASYNTGIIKFIIPYEMLKPIIWKDGPLGWAVKE